MEGPKHISFVIRYLSHLMDRTMCLKHGGEDGVTAYHGRIIGYLFERRSEDVFQRDIESRFGIRRSTVTNVLQTMESNGLITRTSVMSDGRLKKINLTEKAIAMHERFRKEINLFEEAVSDGLTEEERKSFFVISEKIYNNLTELERNEKNAENSFIKGKGI